MFLDLIQPAAILWQISEGKLDITKQTEWAWQLFREAITIPAETTPRRSKHFPQEV